MQGPPWGRCEANPGRRVLSGKPARGVSAKGAVQGRCLGLGRGNPHAVPSCLHARMTPPLWRHTGCALWAAVSIAMAPALTKSQPSPGESKPGARPPASTSSQTLAAPRPCTRSFLLGSVHGLPFCGLVYHPSPPFPLRPERANEPAAGCVADLPQLVPMLRPSYIRLAVYYFMQTRNPMLVPFRGSSAAFSSLHWPALPPSGLRPPSAPARVRIHCPGVPRFISPLPPARRAGSCGDLWPKNCECYKTCQLLYCDEMRKEPCTHELGQYMWDAHCWVYRDPTVPVSSRLPENVVAETIGYNRMPWDVSRGDRG